MNRDQKEALVTALQQHLDTSAIVVVTHNLGLSVADVTSLRTQMREAGGQYKVYKNTLSKRAVKDTPYESVSELLQGPTALSYSEDPVAVAKTLVKFAKDNDRLEVVGGNLGERTLTVKEIEALATMPSLDELRAKIVGMLNTPATRIAGVLQAPAGQLARVCGAYGASE